MMRTALLIACLFSGLIAFGQRNVADSAIATPWVSVHYGINGTAGDLAERHGIFSHVGMFAGYKTKRNWIFGADGSYMFGNQVKATGLFDHLVDSKGNITDQNGDIAIVQVLSRGFHANANVGKIFPVISPNENSGIYLNLGVGYVMHKFRIETQDHVVPQLELEYKKGYDRLTTGLNTQQLLGYAFMANQGFVNLYGGFYCQQGFTYNRRTVNFDQPDTPVSTDMRLDIQYGFKLAWLIPIYKRKPKDYYFN
jgi:hypothetical protein